MHVARFFRRVLRFQINHIVLHLHANASVSANGSAVSCIPIQIIVKIRQGRSRHGVKETRTIGGSTVILTRTIQLVIGQCSMHEILAASHG
ncbi:hypothetical protein NC77_02470 [Janthinobacterium lividum]|nr:hypothetical protein NC77_02470 [Janthinobacterium lividum]